MTSAPPHKAFTCTLHFGALVATPPQNTDARVAATDFCLLPHPPNPLDAWQVHMIWELTTTSEMLNVSPLHKYYFWQVP